MLCFTSRTKEILSPNGGVSASLETSYCVVSVAGTPRFMTVSLKQQSPRSPLRSASWEVTPTLLEGSDSCSSQAEHSFQAHPDVSVRVLSAFLFHLSSQPQDSHPPPSPEPPHYSSAFLGTEDLYPHEILWHCARLRKICTCSIFRNGVLINVSMCGMRVLMKSQH